VQQVLETHPDCAIQTYVSSALRICIAAQERGMELSKVQFIVGSERLSPGKRKAIEASGARVYARYFATEAGSIAFSCGDPEALEDYHLADDTMAMIPCEAGGNQGGTLLTTSLLATGPKVLINADLGDRGRLIERSCSCLVGEMGFRKHVVGVSSARRATTEGMALPYAELIRQAEELLPAHFGGSALDYQWVELEDDHALTRLRLRTSPRLGKLDASEVRNYIFEQLLRSDKRNRLYVEIWRQAGTLEIVSELPVTTSLGKQHPLVKLSPPKAYDADDISPNTSSTER
jgi:hypothetical protein